MSALPALDKTSEVLEKWDVPLMLRSWPEQGFFFKSFVYPLVPKEHSQVVT